MKNKIINIIGIVILILILSLGDNVYAEEQYKCLYEDILEIEYNPKNKKVTWHGNLISENCGDISTPCKVVNHVYEVEGTGLMTRLDQKKWHFFDSSNKFQCPEIFYSISCYTSVDNKNTCKYSFSPSKNEKENINFSSNSSINKSPINSTNNSCCLYTGNSEEYIYVYELADINANAKLPAICYGLNCPTNDFANKRNSQLINIQNQPWWATYYSNLNSCENMPKNIWFKQTDKKVEFYTNEVEGATETTLNTSEACSVDLTYNTQEHNSSEIDWGDEVDVNCRGILGDELLDFINKIFRWIRIIAPIFVIVMAGVEYASAILKDDKDALNKANSRFIKRLIIAVALFFVPLILQWLLGIFNEVSGSFTSTCGIGE